MRRIFRTGFPSETFVSIITCRVSDLEAFTSRARDNLRTSDKTHVWYTSVIVAKKLSHTRRSQYHTKPTIYESLFLVYSLFVIKRIADDAPALLKSYHMPADALSVYRSTGLFSSAENCVSHGNPTLWSHVRCRTSSTMRHASCTIFYTMCTSATNAISCAVPFLPDGNDITRKRGKKWRHMYVQFLSHF